MRPTCAHCSVLLPSVPDECLSPLPCHYHLLTKTIHPDFLFPTHPQFSPRPKIHDTHPDGGGAAEKADVKGILHLQLSNYRCEKEREVGDLAKALPSLQPNSLRREESCTFHWRILLNLGHKLVPRLHKSDVGGNRIHRNK